MKWEEAPDILTPADLSQILGVGKNVSESMYHIKTFPKIQGTNKLIADKEAVKYWCMGIDVETAVVKNIITQILKSEGR